MLFALLPGAGCEPWIWHRVVPALQQRGHEAIAVRLPYNNPRAGLPEYADAVTGAIGAREDVALVAQSIAGFVAPIVCTRLPVRLLVFVNAMIPLPGETAGAWWEHVDHASALAPVVAEHGPLESWDAAAQVAVFLNDVEPALAAESANHVGPPGAGIFSSPLTIDAWPDVPTRALAGRRDRFSRSSSNAASRASACSSSSTESTVGTRRCSPAPRSLRHAWPPTRTSSDRPPLRRPRIRPRPRRRKGSLVLTAAPARPNRRVPVLTARQGSGTRSPSVSKIAMRRA